MCGESGHREGLVQLTLFSDYALRMVLYLGAHEDRVVSLDELSRAYGISKNHLVKVAGVLLDLKVIETVRGRAGGAKLACRPGEINIGWLVRRTEPNMSIVECFDRGTNRCPIAPVCSLKGLLEEARDAFLASLDRHTLADLLRQPERLVVLWRRTAAKAGRNAPP
jgi:Rrf2 family nitric oxide-sensitive transcriptional repressor